MGGRTKWADIQGAVTPERRKRIDAIKAQAHAVSFNLGELRKARRLTQVERADPK